MGYAQDDANLWSRLIFSWVNPLIKKGVAGSLKKIEDLFDLPDALSVSQLYLKMQISLSGPTKLFWALHKAFGKEFYAIGILRFIADTAGFAGPLLLGGLLSQHANENSNIPYYYAMGLFATTLLCE